MTSISELRKQLDEVKASILAFTIGIHDVVESIYSKMDTLEIENYQEPTTGPTVERPTTETNLRDNDN